MISDFSLESIYAKRKPLCDRFGDSFAQFIEVMQVDPLDRDRFCLFTAFVEQLVAAGLIRQGPSANMFYAADVSWQHAFEIWNFYEIYRGTPFINKPDADTICFYS